MGWSAARSWPGSSTSSSRTVWVDGAAEACPPSGLASSPSAGASGAPSRSSLTRPPPRGARRARSGTVLSAGRSGRLLAPSRCAERESCPSAYPEEVGGSGISLRRWQALPRFGRVNSRHGEPDSSPRPAEARRTDRRQKGNAEQPADRVVDLEVVDRLREFELHPLALADLHDLLALEVVDEHAEARVLGVPRGAALGGRADVGGEPDHPPDGRDALDDHQVALLVHVVDATAAALDLAGGRAHVLRGDVDTDVLNRFEQADLAVDQRAVDRVADRRDDLRRTAVDGVLVELRVVEPEQRPLDRLGGQRAVVERLLKPFEDELHRLVEVLDPLRVVDEDVRPVDVLDVLGGVLVHAGVLQRLAALQFGHVHRDLAELDGVDDLLGHRLDGDVELVVAVRRLPLDLAGGLLGRLAEDDDRLTGVDRDALVALDALADDFEVELTLPGDEVLAGVLVDLDLDRRVLLGDLLERLDELRQVVHVLGLDGLRDDRLGDVFDRLERRHLHGGDGGAGDGVTQPRDRGDVPRRDAIHLLAFGPHEEPDALDAVLPRCAGDVQLLALLQRPGEDAARRDLARVRVHRDVGDHEDDLAVLVDHPHRVGQLALRVAAPDARDTTGLGVDRVREVLADHVEHDVRQRRPLVELLALVVLLELHDVAEVHAGPLHRGHRDAPLVQRGAEPDRAVLDRDGPVLGDVVHVLGHPADELVDVGDDRHQPLLHLLGPLLELADEAVDLVDEQRRLHALAERLPEDRLGLGHRALDGVDDHQRAVDRAHRAGDVAPEVHVARGVDEVDEVVGVLVLVGHRNVRRVDGDSPLLLVFLRVHRELLARGVLRDHAGTGQQVVGERRLPVVDVRGDGDVPDVLRVVHQPLALLNDLLASAHYTACYR